MKTKNIILVLLLLMGSAIGLWSQIIWSENFDSVTAPNIPAGWTIVDANNDGKTWATNSTYSNTPLNSMYYAYSYSQAANDYAISPGLSLVGGKTYWIDFHYRCYNASYVEKLKLMVGTAPTAADMDITLLDLSNITATTFQHARGIFTPTEDGTYYLGWYVYSDINKWNLYFDSVSVREEPTGAVFNLSPDVPDYDFGNLLINDSATKTFRVSNTGIADLTFSSVTVSGTGFSPDPAFNYDPIPPNDYRDFTVKFTPPTAATYNGTLNFNFNRETRSVALSGTGIPYGISTATSTSDDDIGQIILGSFANPVTAPTPLTYNTTANQMYNDYTALGPINVQKTVDTPFSLTQINSGSYYTCHFKVFIDYNQNQVFDLPDELALTGSTSSSYGGSNPYNGSITIPLTALEGQTRMRVVLQETSNPDLVLPVGTYSWGETEDYTVNITAPPAVITPSNLTANNVTGNSALLGWTENNTPPATQWDLVYGAPGFDPDSATPTNVGINPYPLTGLSPSTTYQWYVRSNLGNNDTSGWGGPGLFTTTQIPATLPFAEDWESGQNGWTIVNGSQTNAWHIGTADPFGETGHSAYISNDAGTSNAYTVTSTSVSHIYRDIAFDNDCLNFPLSFMWKCNGEGTTYVYDYLQVHLVDTSVVPVAGTLLSSGTLGTYNQQTTWQQANITLPGSYSGTSKRLVFSWRNDTSIGYQPPANIDNIILTAVPVPSGPVEPPILIYPEIRQENLPITGFPYQFGWNTGGTEPETYILYIAALDDLSENFDMDEFFNVAESYDDNVTSPYTPDFTYDYEKWYVWTVSGSNTTYPDEVFEWPPYEFVIERDPTIIIPHTQDFGTDSNWTSGWTQAYSGGVTSNRWSKSNTANAGGTAYEMMCSWASGTGVSRLITPPIKTVGMDSFVVNFKNYYNDYGTGITGKLQYSHDLNTWNDTGWSFASGSGSFTASERIVVSGLSAPVTYLAWMMDGNHYQFNYWYVDDVKLSELFAHDVAVTGFVSPAGVIINSGSAVVEVMVENLGTNPESFQLKLNDGVYDHTQPVSLDAGDSAIVTFENVSILDYTIATLTATAILSTDQNLDNNEIETVVLALPVDVQAYADRAYDPVANEGPCTFNLKSPGSIADLPAINPFTNFLAGADWIDGAWLGSEYNTAGSPWWEIDHITGAATQLGSCGTSIHGIAWDANNDIVYGTDGESLYTLDKETGLATEVGELTWEGEAIVGSFLGLAYDNTYDILYGLGVFMNGTIGMNGVFTIDLNTLEVEPLGYTTGYNLNYAQDMAFDQNTGLLYLSAYDDGLDGMLLLVNTFAPDNDGLLGDCFLVGPFENGAEIDGFAIPWGYDIITPELEIDSDGTLSWSDTNALYYYIYGSNDPYDGYTLLHTTSSTSWLDPSFGEDMKFYYVTTANFAPSSRVTPRIENAHLLPRNGQRLTREVRTIQNVEGRAPKHTPSKNRIQK